MIRTSAPGSIMLLGEHAVLHGHRALVLAVNQRLTVELIERDDNQILVTSQLGSCQGTTELLPDSPALSFICQCIRHCKPSRGFTMTIKSDISPTVGLASSAAATAACIAALRTLNGESTKLSNLLKDCVNVIRTVQGRGSGADVAACLYGGAVAYDAAKIEAQSASFNRPFSLYYLGYKTPTPKVLELVNTWHKQSPQSYEMLYQGMGKLVEDGLTACAEQDDADLARIMRQYQGYMHALGVADAPTLSLLSQLAREPNCQAAKISGSGLGDCIIAMGENLPSLEFEHIAVSSSKTGVTIEQS